MSLDSPPPRLESLARPPAQLLEKRRRVLVLAAGAVVLALLGASVANARRAELRCIDGRLVAYEGRMLPLGEEPIDDDHLAPLRVPPSLCEDQAFADRSELQARYMEIAVGRADEAIRSDDRELLETSLDALEGLPPGTDEALTARYRQLVEALLRVDVQAARQSHEQALRRIEQARQAGVDEARLRAAEQSLGLVAGDHGSLVPVAEDREPHDEPEPPPVELVPVPDEAAAPRSL